MKKKKNRESNAGQFVKRRETTKGEKNGARIGDQLKRKKKGNEKQGKKMRKGKNSLKGGKEE